MATLNKERLIYVVIILPIVLLLVAIWVTSSKPVYNIERNIRYGFTLQNTTNKVLKKVDFWVYAPVKQTSNQLSGEISASQPYKIVEDNIGNQLLHFVFDTFPPYATRVVSIDAQLHLASAPNKVRLENSELYLQSEKYIETKNRNIIQLASQLGESTKLKTAGNLLKWVNKNIAYAGYIKDDRGAVYALENKKGDCTEYMYLYSALARVNRIPTRGIGGYVYGEDRVLKAEDFHNWSEIYINSMWQIVDPQNGKFLESQSDFIAMRIISNDSGNHFKLANTHRFMASNKNIEITMN